MYNKWNDVKGKIDSQSPLIHCITSPIAINDCANAVLGISGELADDSRGLGTYHIGLIDSLSLMDSEKFSQMAKIKKYNK